MTIRPVAPADLASLADLAAATIREPFGLPHKPESLVDAYNAPACLDSGLVPETVIYGEND